MAELSNYIPGILAAIVFVLVAISTFIFTRKFEKLRWLIWVFPVIALSSPYIIFPELTMVTLEEGIISNVVGENIAYLLIGGLPAYFIFRKKKPKKEKNS